MARIALHPIGAPLTLDAVKAQLAALAHRHSGHHPEHDLAYLL